MALVSAGNSSDILTSSSPALQPAEEECGGSCMKAPVLGEPAAAAPHLLPELGREQWPIKRTYLHPEHPGGPQVLAGHPSLPQPTASAPPGFQEWPTDTSWVHHK